MRNYLLPYPAKWFGLLNVFGDCFTKPQFGNFCQSATCMAVSQHSEPSRWCYVFEEKHQSTLNDFFTVSPWDETEVYSRLCRLAKRRITDAHIAVIDDTMSHKPYAEKMEHAGYFYDGLTKEKQKGHSIVTCGLCSNELGFVPFGVELYKKDSRRSKNDMARDLIKIIQNNRQIMLYIFDSWYSNVELLKDIKIKGSHWLTEFKSNRNATISDMKRALESHAKQIKEKDFKILQHKGSKYRHFQTSAFIKGLGNVNLVFSQRYEEKDEKWGDMYYLATDILTLPGDRVIELFLMRGGIEGFHREAKQQIGMEDYHLRKSRGIERYLLLVLLVYILLQLLNQQQMRTTFKSKTIGELCIELKAECHIILLQNAKDKPREELEKLSYNWARGI